MESIINTDQIKIKRDYPPESITASDEMLPEYRDLLIRVLANQARAEDGAANLYLRWAQRARDPIIRTRLLELAQEEVSHWAGCVNLLYELGIDYKNVEANYSPTWFYIVFRVITLPNKWLDIPVFSYLFEQVGYIMIEDYAQSSYRPHAKLAQIILVEEAEHPESSAEFIKQLIDSHGKIPVQRSLRKIWPLALNSFGPSNISRDRRYVELGLKVRTNDGRRKAFCAHCSKQLSKLGLNIPSLKHSKYPYL